MERIDGVEKMQDSSEREVALHGGNHQELKAPSSALNIDIMDFQFDAMSSAEWPSTPCLQDLIEDPYPTAAVVEETGAESSALVTALSTMVTNMNNTSFYMEEFNNVYSHHSDIPPDGCSSSYQPNKSPFSLDSNHGDDLTPEFLQPTSPEMYPRGDPLISDVTIGPKLAIESPKSDHLSFCEEDSFILLNPQEFLIAQGAIETCPSPRDNMSQDCRLPVLAEKDLASVLGESQPTKKAHLDLEQAIDEPNKTKDSPAEKAPVKTTTKMTLQKAIKDRRRSRGLSEVVIEPKRARNNELTDTDVERLRRRQASNRKAAAKCRQKRKEQEEEIQKKTNLLEQENAQLRLEILEERNKVKEYMAVMEKHRDICPLRKSKVLVE